MKISDKVLYNDFYMLCKNRSHSTIFALVAFLEECEFVEIFLDF